MLDYKKLPIFLHDRDSATRVIVFLKQSFIGRPRMVADKYEQFDEEQDERADGVSRRTVMQGMAGAGIALSGLRPLTGTAVARGVPKADAKRVADGHARRVWGSKIGRGPLLPLRRANGLAVGYAIPYVVGERTFPRTERLRGVVQGAVADARRRSADEGTIETGVILDTVFSDVRSQVGHFGTIYVSSSRETVPVLQVSHYLHPYFSAGDLAWELAAEYLDSTEHQLRNIYFFSPAEEYFEFADGDDRVLVHTDTLEVSAPEPVLEAGEEVNKCLDIGEPPGNETADLEVPATDDVAASATFARQRRRAWQAALSSDATTTDAGSTVHPAMELDAAIEASPSEQGTPVGIERTGLAADDADSFDVTLYSSRRDSSPIGIDPEDVEGGGMERIPYWELIPIVDWTYWCVPTAYTMAVGFWDNYVPGVGTILGYGRLIDYWFDHPTGSNVPNMLDELIDPTLTPPTWSGWTINDNGYNFSYTSIAGTVANDWAWDTIQSEIDSGRPTVWQACCNKKGEPHNMTVFGTRISGGQKFLILYTTWGLTQQQQYREVPYNVWEGKPVQYTGVGRLVPGGATTGQQVVLTWPRGGDTLGLDTPEIVSWYVWGDQTTETRISMSTDGGRTWQTLASNVTTSPGWNSYVWIPRTATTTARVRVEGFTEQGTYVAGDGSYTDVTVGRELPGRHEWSSLGIPAGGNVRAHQIVAGNNEDGRVELYAVGIDGAIWHRYQLQPNGNQWAGWTNMGHPSGVWFGTATVGMNADGRQELFAISNDGAIWHNYQTSPNDGWTGWGTMSHPANVSLRRLAVAENDDGRLELFAIGDDNQLWHRYQPEPSKGPWSPWTSLGKPPGERGMYSLAVGRTVDGRLGAFVGSGVPTGEFGLTDVAVWHTAQPAPNHEGSGWTAWRSMGNPTSGGGQLTPFVGRNQDGRLELFAVDEGDLWHRWQRADGSWTGWSSLGGPTGMTSLLSLLTIGVNRGGRLEVFGSGITGKGPTSTIDTWHVWQTAPNDGWNGWFSLGTPPGVTLSQHAVAPNEDGRLVLFGLADDGSVRLIEQGS